MLQQLSQIYYFVVGLYLGRNPLRSHQLQQGGFWHLLAILLDSRRLNPCFQEFTAVALLLIIDLSRNQAGEALGHQSQRWSCCCCCFMMGGRRLVSALERRKLKLAPKACCCYSCQSQKLGHLHSLCPRLSRTPQFQVVASFVAVEVVSYQPLLDYWFVSPLIASLALQVYHYYLAS